MKRERTKIDEVSESTLLQEAARGSVTRRHGL